LRTLRLFAVLLALAIVALLSGVYVAIHSDVLKIQGIVRRAVEHPLPPRIVSAIVAVEDPGFLHRRRGVPRKGHGASLTSQLVKNHVDGRGVQRHFSETATAFTIELLEPKAAIAQAYASNVYLGKPTGAPVYGVEAASRGYFGVTAGKLSVAQLASIAAAIRRPSEFSPTTHTDRAAMRRLRVLQEMFRSGVISASEFAAAQRSLSVAPSNSTLQLSRPGVGSAAELPGAARVKMNHGFGTRNWPRS
jgi:membrane carboxypeptidase/penicillin-binding protein